MFPIVNLKYNKDLESGDFFFYYGYLVVCVFKACD
jgi:hypothetical protein